MVGWLFALLSYHSWVLFSSLTVTYVLYLNMSDSARKEKKALLPAHLGKKQQKGAAESSIFHRARMRRIYLRRVMTTWRLGSSPSLWVST